MEKTSKLRPDGIKRQAKVSLSLACQLVGAGVVPAAPVIAPRPAPAASRINWAISSGCATYDAWLVSIEIVVAFIRCANIRCVSGGIMWSLSDT